jgi:hypothetical protein
VGEFRNSLGHSRNGRREVPRRAAGTERCSHFAEYTPNPQWPSFLTQVERNDPGFAISQRKRTLVEKVFG